MKVIEAPITALNQQRAATDHPEPGKRRGKIWIKAERQGDAQTMFGETVSILITDPDDYEKVLFKAGPYTISNGSLVSHELLEGVFLF